MNVLLVLVLVPSRPSSSKADCFINCSTRTAAAHHKEYDGLFTVYVRILYMPPTGHLGPPFLLTSCRWPAGRVGWGGNIGLSCACSVCRAMSCTYGGIGFNKWGTLCMVIESHQEQNGHVCLHRFDELRIDHEARKEKRNIVLGSYREGTLSYFPVAGLNTFLDTVGWPVQRIVRIRLPENTPDDIWRRYIYFLEVNIFRLRIVRRFWRCRQSNKNKK